MSIDTSESTLFRPVMRHPLVFIHEEIDLGSAATVALSVYFVTQYGVLKSLPFSYSFRMSEGTFTTCNSIHH